MTEATIHCDNFAEAAVLIGDAAGLQTELARLIAIYAIDTYPMALLEVIAQKGVDQFTATEIADFRPAADELTISTLYMALRAGHLPTVRWLLATYSTTLRHLYRGNDMLRAACRHGHLEVAQWLVRTFGIQAADVRAKNNLVLNTACVYGHTELAAWLTTTFGLAAGDARAYGNATFHRVCMHSHLSTAQWMVATFGLTEADASRVRYLYSPSMRSWLDGLAS